MRIKPGVHIKKDEQDEKIFIIEDSLVTWIRHGDGEISCNVPESWASEIVAIVIRKNKEGNFSDMLMSGVAVGKKETGVCKIVHPSGGIISKEEADQYTNDGKITYNGSVFRLMA